jgi:hypothetical protein
LFTVMLENTFAVTNLLSGIEIFVWKRRPFAGSTA